MEMQYDNISVNNFEQCSKCSICTAYCPVTAVNPIYPGPKHSGPDGERYRLKDPVFFNEALKYCLNCKRCEVACPSNVKIGDIIQSARIKYTQGRPKLRDIMLANTDAMGTMATMVAPLVNFTLSLKPTKFVMGKVLGIAPERTFPKYASQKFISWYRRDAMKRQDVFPKQLTYFHGCYVNYNNPGQGRCLVAVANALGFGVKMLEREKCCGVAKISNRLIEEARRDAVINMASVRHALADGRGPVVGTSSTCVFTMRDEYPHLLGIDNSDVRDSITLASKWIFELWESGAVKFVFRPGFRMKAAYHTPCHMEKLGWTFYSTNLMRLIPGLELTVLDQNCCGIAGTYGFKKEMYDYSQAIGAATFKQIRGLNPDYVITDCETCRWQIEMSTGYQTLNPIEVLARALDLEATARANGIDPSMLTVKEYS